MEAPFEVKMRALAFDALAEHPETAAAFIVPRARSLVAAGDRSSAVRYLTPLCAAARLLSALAKLPALATQLKTLRLPGMRLHPPCEHREVLTCSCHSSLPRMLASLTCLQHLDLSKNALGRKGMQCLAQASRAQII